jgi:protein-L-isoaspartate(D-aspartate) O-methyltransferase
MTREALIDALRFQVADERVLAALASVPREDFVTPRDRDRAWENVALGIDCGQTISQPLVVARMCEVLAVQPGERVLDVGTGSGYHAAVLVALGARVTGVEIVPELAAAAARRVPEAMIVCGDGRRGHPADAPYDAISVAAAAEQVPAPLLEQLAPGGRLVVPLRRGDAERLVLVTRTDEGFAGEELEEVRFVPLV